MKKPKVWNQWSKIRSALRKVWLYSPQRREALIKVKNGKMYWCSTCNKMMPKWAIDVDHIIPCGSLGSIEDVKGFVDRLFHGQLQILCKVCHTLKTHKKEK